MENMNAILVEKRGGPEMLKIRTVPKPRVLPDQVLIEVKAFGINRAEMYMREGKWPEIAEIIGIECVGLVAEDPSGKFKKGQKVVAVMGGMGRTINGSYAQFTSAPVRNVAPVETELAWPELASIPESFGTAWGALHWALEVKAGQTLLVRGATSALGMATVILARQAGLSVVATTRSNQKIAALEAIGADHVVIDDGRIRQKVRKLYPEGVDRVLDIVGSTALMDSAKTAKKKGIVCMAGFLGGRTFMDKFQPMVERTLQKKGNKFGIRLPGHPRIVFFASSAFGTRHFPLSAVPFQQIVTDVEEKRIPTILSSAYRFEEISKAHRQMETNAGNGKIVIVMQ